MTEQKTGFDYEALRRAVEARDAETLLGFYAEEAEIKAISKDARPGSPRVVSGKDAVEEYLRDVYSRDMTHHLEDEVLGEERVAFHEACRYADGTRVYAAVMLELRDGKIQRQTNVEAWDE